MSRKFALVLATTITVLGLAPAQADGDSAKGALMIPVKAIAFVAGAGVGTPIAIVRKVASNDKAMAGQLSDKDNPLMKGATGLVCLPFAVFKGGLEGSVAGVQNSWKNSSEKPFSGDSFSLGDME